MILARLFVALLAAAAIATGFLSLHGAQGGVESSRHDLDGTPITIFTRTGAEPGPVIVIAHGFAGSQQLMQPLALTLARNGYTALTFDFMGHGRNAQAMPGGIADLERSTQTLLGEIDKVVTHARSLPAAAKGVAIVGHSMGSDLVVQYAMKHEGLAAVVAFSLFGKDVTATQPRNLLVVDGAWEPDMLVDAGRRIVALSAQGPPQTDTTYGDLARGTGRRLVLARGAEHIGVIYSRDGLAAARDWLNDVFGRSSSGDLDRRGPALALLFAGLVAMAWPASRLLPAGPAPKLHVAPGWRRLAPLVVGPAVLTPLLLWKAPTSFLPILLGDYLVLHFALYGLLTWLAMLWLVPTPRLHGWRWLAPGLTLAACCLLALGLPIDAYVTSFAPNATRWPLIAIMFVGTALYFFADEALTRGRTGARGGPAVARICFVLSLVLAVVLNPGKLFFLVIITPVICVLFLVFGLVSRWTFARTRDPRIAALAQAAILAYAIAVTFPVVAP